MIFCQKFQMSDEPAPAPAPAPEPAPADATVPEPSPAPAPAPPPTITIQDIMNAVEVSQTREDEDKTKLEAIGTISFETLRASLLTWATRGFPNAYTIYEVALSAPSVCSDGTSRALPEYIEFCSGKTIAEHVAVLQARLPDITVSFAYSGYSILIVVSKQA
jgi:hypothetical protein